MKKDESGQAAILAVMVLSALLLGGSLGLGVVQKALAERSRAQTAADAAALAGAAAGESAAEQAARGNGATLVKFTIDGQDTVVEARYGSSEAKAKARKGGP